MATAGCDRVGFARDTGRLDILLAPDTSVSTSFADIRTLVVTVSGPNGQLRRDMIPFDPMVRSVVPPGSWTVTVDGLDASAASVGEGTLVAEVERGEVIDAELLLRRRETPDSGPRLPPTEYDPPVLSQRHPSTFLSAAEIEALRARIAAGDEPWASAYAVLLDRADAAMRADLLSVTFQGLSSHDYHTGEAYDWSNNMPSPCWRTYCDGDVNPLADRGDYRAAMLVGRTVRDLAIAYVLSGNVDYAGKATELLRAWAVDPETRMTPAYATPQSLIEISITMPALLFGADLVFDYPLWDPSEKEAFLGWADSLTADALTWSRDNNFENWRLVMISTGAALLEQQPRLDYAFQRWRGLLPSQVGASGQMLQELNRTASLGYSTYAMNAMAQTAEIARHQGVDLYSFVTPDGRGLELVFDYHAPFIEDPSRWPHEQTSPYRGDNAAIMELAFSFRQKPEYMAAISAWGRPMNEIRTLGLTTLTHAFGAYALTTPPSQ
jgi:hypothetical protein